MFNHLDFSTITKDRMKLFGYSFSDKILNPFFSIFSSFQSSTLFPMVLKIGPDLLVIVSIWSDHRSITVLVWSS